MKKTILNLIFLKFLLSLLLVSAPTYGQDEKSAYDVWVDMTEAAINKHRREIVVKDAPVASGAIPVGSNRDLFGRVVTFGGEKEGSSALITRVMGPNRELTRNWVNNLPSDMKEKFLKTFLTDIASGKTFVGSVVNGRGETIEFDRSFMKGKDYLKMNLGELGTAFEEYLDKAGDKHFSFLKKQTRMNIFNGKYGGLSRDYGLKKTKSYGSYKALYGNAERFIDKAHGTSVGWEINFTPQRTYGEFEEMVDWFRESLKNVGKKFQAPGHQWVVYPKYKDLSEAEQLKLFDKMKEVYKNIQAYTVLVGIEGSVGIETSAHKNVHKDANISEKHSLGRGVIRLTNDGYKVDGNPSYAIEYRAGVKSDKIRRKNQKFLISRYAANEFDDLASGNSWTLVGDRGQRFYSNPSAVAKEYDVSHLTAKRFIKNLSGTKRNIVKVSGTSSRSIKAEFVIPFWNWEEAPYLSNEKKKAIKTLTVEFIETVARMKNPSLDDVSLALKDWAKTSRLSHDIENYLTPKLTLADIENAHKYKLPSGAKVDVNDIDLGIEYSARFPLKTNSNFVESPSQAKKFEWVSTQYDYTPKEREAVIKRFAETLGAELNDGKKVTVSKLISDGHGHGLDIAYEVKDTKGRTWRVEWDGIGRSYDGKSSMIDQSVRGGHIEIATPKFQPNPEEMKKVFTAMDKDNLIPQTRFGGGHLNIDLKPFENNPKAMARFIAKYLEHRNVMSAMFQHPGRLLASEPFDVSPQALEYLKNFSGDEAQLKKFLYDNQFFNTRVGRKTKNSQLNLLAYFQDVIPEEFIHEDFDMKNDIWRRSFDVDPKIRKMEFRMFNAPRNAEESALQIKFARALLNEAFNESTPVTAKNVSVDYERLVANPKWADNRFEHTMKDLGLDPKEYRGFFYEGLENVKNMVDSPLYVPKEVRLAEHPKVKDWKEAVEPRSNPIASEGRTWKGREPLPEAKLYKNKQLMARDAAEEARSHLSKRNKLYREGRRAPLEISLSLDDIKDLAPDDQLMALYYKKSELKKDKAFKAFMEEFRKSDDFSLAVYYAAQNEASHTKGYLKFMADYIPFEYKVKNGNYIKHAYIEMLKSGDESLRKKAVESYFRTKNGLEEMITTALTGNFINNRARMDLIDHLYKNFPKQMDEHASFDKLYRLVEKVENIGDGKNILLMSRKLNKEQKAKIHFKLLESPNPKLRNIAAKRLKSSDPLGLYVIAKDGITDKEISTDLRKFFLAVSKDDSILENATAKDFRLTEPRYRGHAAYFVATNPNVSQQQRDKIAKFVNKEYKNGRIFRYGLHSSVERPKEFEWFFQSYQQNNGFAKADQNHALDTLVKILSSNKEEVRARAYEVLSKSDDLELKKAVVTRAFNTNDLVNQKTELLKYVD